MERYLSAVKNASVVIGNSSSGIIEVPSFDVPTVNIGSRQGGRMAAKSVLHCNVDQHDIRSKIQEAVSRSYKQKDEIIDNPYGQGDASKQVIEMIKNIASTEIKKFHDLEVIS